jgi:hypothetical protein
MELSEKVRNHIIVIVAGAFAAGAALAWTVADQVWIGPKNDEIARLKERIAEVRENGSGEAGEGTRVAELEARSKQLAGELQEARKQVLTLTTQLEAFGRPVDPPVASAGGAQSQTVEGVSFELKGCDLRSDEVDCKLVATPTQQDKLLTFWGSSRLFHNGTELTTSRITLGNAETTRGRYASLQKELVRSVPMNMGVSFAGVAPGTKTVDLIELVFSGFKVKFRDVQLN